MMYALVRFAVDKLGGIGAAVGAALGYWYWDENAVANCSTSSLGLTCGEEGVRVLEFAGARLGPEAFSGMTMCLGAGLYLGGAAVVRHLESRQSAGTAA